MSSISTNEASAVVLSWIASGKLKQGIHVVHLLIGAAVAFASPWRECRKCISDAGRATMPYGIQASKTHSHPGICYNVILTIYEWWTDIGLSFEAVAWSDPERVVRSRHMAQIVRSSWVHGYIFDKITHLSKFVSPLRGLFDAD
ncbi:hypothetical protein Golob_008951 [Gossypium lobatum]|uniref:Uncharacterized protein n=1 Tax=Gossypium lobatum TaxID=34289 RepID=A0A7J8MHE8_9ROSI|nr:hypothetical protein [Gossypium lobatum]